MSGVPARYPVVIVDFGFGSRDGEQQISCMRTDIIEHFKNLVDTVCNDMVSDTHLTKVQFLKAEMEKRFPTRPPSTLWQALVNEDEFSEIPEERAPLDYVIAESNGVYYYIYHDATVPDNTVPRHGQPRHAVFVITSDAAPNSVTGKRDQNIGREVAKTFQDLIERLCNNGRSVGDAEMEVVQQIMERIFPGRQICDVSVTPWLVDQGHPHEDVHSQTRSICRVQYVRVHCNDRDYVLWRECIIVGIAKDGQIKYDVVMGKQIGFESWTELRIEALTTLVRNTIDNSCNKRRRDSPTQREDGMERVLSANVPGVWMVKVGQNGLGEFLEIKPNEKMIVAMCAGLEYTMVVTDHPGNKDDCIPDNRDEELEKAKPESREIIKFRQRGFAHFACRQRSYFCCFPSIVCCGFRPLTEE